VSFTLLRFSLFGSRSRSVLGRSFGVSVRLPFDSRSGHPEHRRGVGGHYVREFDVRSVRL
jgi:hypothetical protein